jgi:uncharacterized protein
MNVALLLNLTLIALVLTLLARRLRGGASLSTTVLLGLTLGVVLGAGLQWGYGHGDPTLRDTLSWLSIVSGGYVRLLQMIVIPLVLVSVLSAVTTLGDVRALGKISAGVLGVLLLTTAISAAIGVAVTQLFGLSAEGLVQGSRELARGTALESRAGELANVTVPQLLLSFIPTNIFSELTGSRPTSIISVVIFGTLLGLAALGVRREVPELGKRIVATIEALQHLVMRLVRMVIRLTPYGVLALMTSVVATSNPEDIASLLGFVLASYLGLTLILAAHAVLLGISGVNPLRHFHDIWPVLAFAFTSRSSAAAIPLNVQTQVDRLGVSPGIANFAAAFGATIGQNGCAGLYPAMLAVMIAPSAGIDPTSFPFVISVIAIAALGSFGIAGVGGGATFAAILVLSTLGLPIALAGLLIAIEPLVDMGRTAVNVSGSITAGAITNRLLRETDPPVVEPPGEIAAAPSWPEECRSPAVPAA